MLVIKIGGADGIDDAAVCDDVAQLARDGRPVVLVHGGSAETNRVAEALGHPPRFITSPSGYTSRLTDRAALEVFEMVYCGKRNKGLVEALQTRGVNAIGLSGLDAGIWTGPRKKAIKAVEDGRVRVVRDTYTGRVDRVNGGFLWNLLELGLVPVLTPPARSEDGEAINVDGDRAAAATAVVLRAESLLLLSNIPGVLRSFPDEGSLVPRIARGELDEARGWAEGRMRIKLKGAEEALSGGVPRVVIGDARGANPVMNALDGAGTVIQ